MLLRYAVEEVLLLSGAKKIEVIMTISSSMLSPQRLPIYTNWSIVTSGVLMQFVVIVCLFEIEVLA